MTRHVQIERHANGEINACLVWVWERGKKRDRERIENILKRKCTPSTSNQLSHTLTQGERESTTQSREYRMLLTCVNDAQMLDCRMWFFIRIFWGLFYNWRAHKQRFRLIGIKNGAIKFAGYSMGRMTTTTTATTTATTTSTTTIRLRQAIWALCIIHPLEAISQLCSWEIMPKIRHSRKKNWSSKF